MAFNLVNIVAGPVAQAVLQQMGNGAMQVVNTIGISDRERLILASVIVGFFGVFHNNVARPNGAICAELISHSMHVSSSVTTVNFLNLVGQVQCLNACLPQSDAQSVRFFCVRSELGNIKEQ